MVFDPPARDATAAWDRRVSRGLSKTPRIVQAGVEWLRVPRRRWVRWLAAAVLIAASFLWFLPVLGLWMLPLGLALISEDVPSLKGWLESVARWLERRWGAVKRRWRRRPR